VGFVGLIVAACSSPPSSPTPEIILHSGKIVTVNADFEVSESLAVYDGKIMAVGANRVIQSMAGPETTSFDLQGRTVIPGIIDSHSHPVSYGMHIEHYARIKRLGLILHPQTWHLYNLRRNFLDNYGRDYADMTHPYRTLLEEHIPIAGGMDWRVGPQDYFFYMWAAVTRETLEGDVVGPEQCLSREEALRFHTLWAAHSTFEEKVKGSLEAGKVADLVILSDDYLDVALDEIKTIRPLLTMVGGRVVYQDSDYTFP
jgi:predicted amidohydrolase YtcJ